MGGVLLLNVILLGATLGAACTLLAFTFAIVFAAQRRFRQALIVLGASFACGAGLVGVLAALGWLTSTETAVCLFLFGAGGPGVAAGVTCLIVEIVQKIVRRPRVSKSAV